MDIEPLRLEAGEAADNVLESMAHLIEIVQALPDAEVTEVVGAQLVAQVRQELLILPDKCILKVCLEDVMTMLYLIDEGLKLSAMFAVDPRTENISDLVGGQS